MARLRLRGRIGADPENGLAPCHSLILTPEHVKNRFVIYTETLEKFLSMQTQSDVDIRALAKRWPRRSLSQDYAHELRVTHRLILELDPNGRRLLKIKVIGATGPMDFIFQLHKMSGDFKALEGHMKIFYDDPDTNYADPNYVIATGIYQGCYYAAFSRRRRQWVRVLCQSDVPIIKPESMALVTLIDYGCNENILGSQMRPLIPSFCTLPAQGYTGSLTEFCTLSDGVDQLPANLVQQFRFKVIGKTFYAHICQLNTPNTWGDQKVKPDATMYLATLDKKIIAFKNDGAGRKIMYETDNIDDLLGTNNN